MNRSFPQLFYVNSIVVATSLNAESSRKQFLAQSAAFAAALVFAPTQSQAAKYGDFGAGSPLVLDASTAEVDADILGSSAVQGAISKIRGYKASAQEMKKTLQADSQANIRPYIVKELDFATIRDTMNTFNTAFDEDTQRGTDRLIRVIMQDITELEQANAQKDGIPRSERRLDTMYSKLAKLDNAFGDFLAFAK